MPIFPGMATTLIPEDELCVEFPAMSVGLADGCGGIVYEVSDLRIILRDEATRIYGGFRPACLSPSSLRRFFWLSSPLSSVPRVTPLPEIAGLVTGQGQKEDLSRTATVTAVQAAQGLFSHILPTLARRCAGGAFEHFCRPMGCGYDGPACPPPYALDCSVK